jgi:hypothetical protein
VEHGEQSLRQARTDNGDLTGRPEPSLTHTHTYQMPDRQYPTTSRTPINQNHHPVFDAFPRRKSNHLDVISQKSSTIYDLV